VKKKKLGEGSSSKTDEGAAGLHVGKGEESPEPINISKTGVHVSAGGHVACRRARVRLEKGGEAWASPVGSQTPPKKGVKEFRKGGREKVGQIRKKSKSLGQGKFGVKIRCGNRPRARRRNQIRKAGGSLGGSSRLVCGGRGGKKGVEIPIANTKEKGKGGTKKKSERIRPRRVVTKTPLGYRGVKQCFGPEDATGAGGKHGKSSPLGNECKVKVVPAVGKGEPELQGRRGLGMEERWNSRENEIQGPKL